MPRTRVSAPWNRLACSAPTAGEPTVGRRSIDRALSELILLSDPWATTAACSVSPEWLENAWPPGGKKDKLAQHGVGYEAGNAVGYEAGNGGK